MVILYLYSELVGYQMPVLKTYVDAYKAKVHVISWDKNKLKPYTPPDIENVFFTKRSAYNKKTLLDYCLAIKPDIVYVSGWMDKDYLHATKRLKKMSIPVVAGFDDIWTGSFRQKIGSLIFPVVYKRYFSHAWVAGAYQFEFAKKLGFKNDEIIFDLLTANTNSFTTKSNEIRSSINANFLYVGNFRKVKGTDILIDAFKIYREKYNGKWGLTFVGNGDLESYLMQNSEVKIYPFSNEEKLMQIAESSDVFILPSRHDQWGVVVHEFTALGKPLILSENVGAKSTFFINGFNGFLFRNNSVEDLAKKMLEMSNLPVERLNQMSRNSLLLSKKINVETSAANFISLIIK